MVRAIAILCMGMWLFGADLLDRVQRILGPQLYEKNQQVIRTLFANESRYYKDGAVDLVRVLEVLERVGVIPLEFSKTTPQQILFVTGPDQVVGLFEKLSEYALERSGLYGVRLVQMERGERLVQRYLHRSRKALRPSIVVAFFQRNGGRVVEVEYENGWRFVVDVTMAKLPARKIEGTIQLENIRSALWLDLCHKRHLEVQTLGRSWYPQIAIYDRYLRPLRFEASDRPKKGVALALPNGACYIKISDRFSPKNLKYGLRVSVR